MTIYQLIFTLKYTLKYTLPFSLRDIKILAQNISMRDLNQSQHSKMCKDNTFWSHGLSIVQRASCIKNLYVSVDGKGIHDNIKTLYLENTLTGKTNTLTSQIFILTCKLCTYLLVNFVTFSYFESTFDKTYQVFILYKGKKSPD